MKANIRATLENFFHLSKPVLAEPHEAGLLDPQCAYDLRYTKPDLERLIQDLENMVNGPGKATSDRLKVLTDAMVAYCDRCQTCDASGQVDGATCPACGWARDALQVAAAPQAAESAPDAKPAVSLASTRRPLFIRDAKPAVSLASTRRPLFIQDHQVYISWHYPTSPEWLERFRKHGVRTIERDQTICVHVDDASKAVEVDCQYAVELVFQRRRECALKQSRPLGETEHLVHYDDPQQKLPCAGQ